MRFASLLLVAFVGLVSAKSQGDGFRPVFGFPYLLGFKKGKGEKKALEEKVLQETPTRFEFQRACYVFIYDLLQKHRSVMKEPEQLRESLMHDCVEEDKKDCGKWADELVVVLQKKEAEEKKTRQHHRMHHTSSRATPQHGEPTPHHHAKKEHVEDMPPHEQKNHPHHESKEALRGVKKAAKKVEPASEVEHVSGKEFVPKAKAGKVEELKSEVWTPPKRKHYRSGLLQLADDTDRYDTWCDALYAKGGGVVDKSIKKPEASDSVPKAQKK